MLIWCVVGVGVLPAVPDAPDHAVQPPPHFSRLLTAAMGMLGIYKAQSAFFQKSIAAVSALGSHSVLLLMAVLDTSE